MPQTDQATEDRIVYRKSTKSTNNGSCVEVGIGRDRVNVRDSKLDQSPVLAFSYTAWAIFLADVRAGLLS